jgi:hypothetical protein
MKYYIIHNSTGEDVGKVFPQISFINQQDAFSLEFDKFVKIPTLIAKTNRGTKITDSMSEASISGSGILINNKIKSILLCFNLMPHKFYEVIIETKKESMSYYWLHFIKQDSVLQNIDYPKSKFYWTEYGYKEQNLSLKSYKDYLQKKKERDFMWGISANNIVFTGKFDENLDFFHLATLFTPKMLFISERLKNALIENKITGIEITEAPISFG